MKNVFSVFLATLAVAFALSSCDTLEVDKPGLLVPMTVDEDASLPSIAVNGTKLHSEAFGDPNNPMIVVIHGGPGSDYRSMLNIRQFSQDSFYVVFYDQRGSGLSKRHGKEVYTIPLFIADLDAVISHYRTAPDQKVILMGLSWGAMLATAYVNEYPAVVSGVVLMEPGGFTWDDTEEYIKRTRELGIFQELSNDYLYLDQILTGSDHNELDYKAALHNAATFSEGNKLGHPGPYPFWRVGAVAGIACNEFVQDHPFDFTTNLQLYTTKVLFLYSELNEAYGKAHAEMVSAAYPSVQLVEVLGTGHEIPYFGWDKFYPIAKAYLDTIQ